MTADERRSAAWAFILAQAAIECLSSPDSPGLCLVGCKGLFAEHVLPRPEGLFGPLAVEAVGEACTTQGKEAKAAVGTGRGEWGREGSKADVSHLCRQHQWLGLPGGRRSPGRIWAACTPRNAQGVEGFRGERAWSSVRSQVAWQRECWEVRGEIQSPLQAAPVPATGGVRGTRGAPGPPHPCSLANSSARFPSLAATATTSQPGSRLAGQMHA